MGNDPFLVYEFADIQKHNPVTEFDKKWVRESMLNACELFLYDQSLRLANYGEQDLLHGVWRFVYRVFADNHIQAQLGEKTGVAVTLARNESRGLEAIDKRPRKNMGSRKDILFTFRGHELGCCEVGKDAVLPIDDKYLDDGLMKLPKSLRDIICIFAETNPAKINDFASVGFLMMGLSLELLIADAPVGSSITRISRTSRLRAPTSFNNIAVDFLPLLEATWKAKELMKQVVETLNDRKRKVVQLADVQNFFTETPYNNPNYSVIPRSSCHYVFLNVAITATLNVCEWKSPRD